MKKLTQKSSKSDAIKRLWAPWRIGYVGGARLKKCIFCLAKNNPKESYVVFTTKHSICLLNIYPYNNGHLMVAPRKHKKSFHELGDTELLDLMNALEHTKDLLTKTIHPQGFNIGINLSEVAGAGIPGHMHIHIVPRWKGDTNFMPVIFNTKVISQSLSQLHKLLKDSHENEYKRIRR